MKHASLLVVILWFAGFSLGAQTNYYVDKQNGNDLNNGTSLTSAWKTIQKACNSATPNSTVQIKGGTYNENIVVNVSGAAGNPILFKNYMTDSVFIDGTGTSGTALLWIANQNYLSFQNLYFQNLTVNAAKGILVETTGSGTSAALSFKAINIRSINWTSNPLTVPSSTNNAQPFIAYGRDGGITDIILDSCQIYNNILGFSEAISLDGNINGFTVKNCRVHDNTNIGIQTGGNYGVSSNPATDHARNGIITRNTCYKNVSRYATSAGIYIDGGRNTIVEKNITYQNGFGIEVGCEQNGTTDTITVKNNLIFNNDVAGLYAGGYTTSTTGQVLNCVFRNNSLFQNNSLNDGTGEMAISKASNCIFENNIFYTNNQNILMSVLNISPQSNNVLNYNDWYTPSNNSGNITVNWRATTFGSFSAYQTGTLQEANSFYNSPLYVNASLPTPDLHILNTSPCINAGDPATTISPGETDFDGNPRILTGRIDIGAYEFSNSAGITQITERNKTIYSYPNPFTSTFSIESEDNLENAELIIYEVMGQELIKIKNLCGHKFLIYRGNWAGGIYMYNLWQDNRLLSTGKLVAE